jgi:hypothetical protein
MTNPIIETDLAIILNEIKLEQKEIRLDQRKILEEVNTVKLGQSNLSGEIRSLDEKLSGEIRTLDKKLSGEIRTLDERLSGKITTLDEKLSGEIKTLDTKVDQLDKRISNSELTNRGILGGIVIIVLGGAAKFFGLIPNP